MFQTNLRFFHLGNRDLQILLYHQLNCRRVDECFDTFARHFLLGNRIEQCQCRATKELVLVNDFSFSRNS
jgi:hypothetical protein